MRPTVSQCVCLCLCLCVCVCVCVCMTGRERHTCTRKCKVHIHIFTQDNLWVYLANCVPCIVTLHETSEFKNRMVCTSAPCTTFDMCHVPDKRRRCVMDSSGYIFLCMILCARVYMFCHGRFWHMLFFQSFYASRVLRPMPVMHTPQTWSTCV
jgi:hypothetical protein